MVTPSPKLSQWKNRLSLKSKISKFFKKHSALQNAVKGNLLWGIVFTILIVLFLIPTIEFRQNQFELNSVAEVTIRAQKDTSIPDFASTQRRRQESIAAMKTVYRFNDTLWQLMEEQLETMFSNGRDSLQQALFELGETSTASSRASLARSADFRTFLLQQQSSEIPESVLSYLIREGFPVELQHRLTTVLSKSFKQPIVNMAIDPPLPSGYLLQPVQDALRENESIISLTAARSDLREAAREIFASAGQYSIDLVNWMESMAGNTAETDPDAMTAQRNEAQDVEIAYFNVRRGEVLARQGDRISNADQLKKINFILTNKDEGIKFVNRSLALLFFASLFMYALHKFSQWYMKRRKVTFHLYLLLGLTMLINVVTIRLVILLSDSLSISLLQDVEIFYWITPFALGAMLVSLLVGTQMATMYSIILVGFSGFLFHGNYHFMIIALIGSISIIYGLRQYRERTALIKSGIALGLMNVITIIALNLLEGKLGNMSELMIAMGMGFAGGIFVTMLASLMLPLFESIFKVVTDIKLLELSNHDHPLLRDLFINAPGTFQHSIVVGYLAEAAANRVGANALFCRVACLYHDVGKIVKSQYYVENSNDLGRKHDKLTPHMSALIIGNHVKEGIELARQFRLPESIINVIPQHHGTKLIRFFFEKAKSNQKPDDVPVKEEEFRYPGPKPQTKEAGIIMIADGVEAAARSLDEPTPGRMKDTIKAIIDNTFLDGQLDECDLTLKDLQKIADAFLKLLVTMKHERIKYPGFDVEKKKESKEAKEAKETKNGNQTTTGENNNNDKV